MSAFPGTAKVAPADNSRVLPALSCGVRLPARGLGTVHSMFARAINLCFAEGPVVVLLEAACPNVPHGVRLAAHDWARLQAALHPGHTAALAGGKLWFRERDLQVDLSRTVRWQATLTRVSIDWGSERVVEAFGAVRGVLRLWACAAPPGDLVSALFLNRIAAMRTALTEATVKLRADSTCEQLRRLVGVGPGLTPSGDDFIIGYLAGLAVGSHGDLARMRFLLHVTKWLELQLGATTLISRQHLSDACHLQFAQPLAELAMAIATGAADVLQPLTAALAVGARSGADGAAGLLFGLEAWRASVTQAGT